MDTLDLIKQKVEMLAQSGEIAYINVSISKPRIRLENVAIRVIGTYRNIFRIEAVDAPPPNCYSLQYTDVLIGQIKWVEPK